MFEIYLNRSNIYFLEFIRLPFRKYLGNKQNQNNVYIVTGALLWWLLTTIYMTRGLGIPVV